MGLHTRIDTSVTVADLRGMGDYDLCIERYEEILQQLISLYQNVRTI